MPTRTANHRPFGLKRGSVRFIRNTKQRQAIQSIFAQHERPLSPEEVHRLASAELPSLGLATVYRTLAALTAEGELAKVEVPGEPARYESAGKHHHHHFLCRSCERMFEVEGCIGNLRPLIPRGFQLQDHHLTLYGVCKGCR